MQLACFIAVDVARPLGGDADPIENPEKPAVLDEFDETAVERDAENLVRVIELAGMGEPEWCPEVGLRSCLEPLFETVDDLLEHSPQHAIKPLCDVAVIGTAILWFRLRSSEWSNRQ